MTTQLQKVRHAFENIRNNYVGWQDNENFKVLEEALAALATVSDTSPSPVSVQPTSEQGLDAAIAKIIQMSASLGLEALLPKAREIIHALSAQPAPQTIGSDAQEPDAVLLKDGNGKWQMQFKTGSHPIEITPQMLAYLPIREDFYRHPPIASTAPDVRPCAWGPILDALDQVPNDIKPEIGHLASLIRRTAPWQVTAPDHAVRAADMPPSVPPITDQYILQRAEHHMFSEDQKGALTECPESGRQIIALVREFIGRPSVPSDAQIKPRDGWAVRVDVDGERILSIESEGLSGVPDIDRYADTVRNCAQHLLSFIGNGGPSEFFPPDDAPVASQAAAPSPLDVITDRDISELISIAQILQEVKQWEAQAGSKILADITKKLVDAKKAAPSASAELLNNWRAIIQDDSLPLGNRLQMIDAQIYMLLDHGKTYPPHIPRAAPSVPDGWRKFVEDCSKTAGGMVNGNKLSILAGRLLAAAPSAPAVPDGLHALLDEIASFQELNEHNYNHADVAEINNWGVMVWERGEELRKAIATSPSAPSVSADAGSQPCPACKGEGAVATDELDVVPCITCQDVEGDADSAAASADAADQMDIDREGARFWHRNCANHLGGVMKVVKDEPTQSLIQCLHCGKSGYYPVGSVGRIRAAIDAQSKEGGAA